MCNKKIETTDYVLGGCPLCGKNDGFLNIHRRHWAVCHQHKACWSIGSNLFSRWRDENEEIWAKNEELLNPYEVVEPIFPKKPLYPDSIIDSVKPKVIDNNDDFLL